MSFIDEVKIFVSGGKGGNGCVSFRREKFIEFGGPDGGNGGDGGNLVLQAIPSINTLLEYRHLQRFIAQSGNPGAKRRMTGKRGDDLLLKVPVGTQVFSEDGETLIADLASQYQTFTLALGGRGGAGNSVFKNSVNQTPRNFIPGTDGESFFATLKLKLLSDVGLIGLPNAGKSTFLSLTTAADPKIASYPFTTLQPMLGVAHSDDSSFVIADLPGLIKGAHLGAGLGHRFLKHIERCRIFLHLIDISQSDIISDYDNICQELYSYDAKLLDKQMIICLTKCDLLAEKEECAFIRDTLHAYCLEQGYDREIFLLENSEINSYNTVISHLATLLLEEKRNSI